MVIVLFIPPLDESQEYIGILMSVRHTFGFRIIIKVPLNQIFSNFHTLPCTIKYRLNLITVYFTFTVHELWPFLSQKIGTFLGFRMIFKVWLNQIFSNFSTMLYTIKYRINLIMVYFTFTVHELWPFLSQKIGTFLGFRMIFKVPLNQIFSNFNTILWTKIWNAGVSVITRSTFSSY